MEYLSKVIENENDIWFLEELKKYSYNCPNKNLIPFLAKMVKYHQKAPYEIGQIVLNSHWDGKYDYFDKLVERSKDKMYESSRPRSIVSHLLNTHPQYESPYFDAVSKLVKMDDASWNVLVKIFGIPDENKYFWKIRVTNMDLKSNLLYKCAIIGKTYPNELDYVLKLKGEFEVNNIQDIVSATIADALYPNSFNAIIKSGRAKSLDEVVQASELLENEIFKKIMDFKTVDGKYFRINSISDIIKWYNVAKDLKSEEFDKMMNMLSADGKEYRINTLEDLQSYCKTKDCRKEMNDILKLKYDKGDYTGGWNYSEQVDNSKDRFSVQSAAALAPVLKKHPKLMELLNLKLNDSEGKISGYAINDISNLEELEKQVNGYIEAYNFNPGKTKELLSQMEKTYHFLGSRFDSLNKNIVQTALEHPVEFEIVSSVKRADGSYYFAGKGVVCFTNLMVKHPILKELINNEFVLKRFIYMKDDKIIKYLDLFDTDKETVLKIFTHPKLQRLDDFQAFKNFYDEYKLNADFIDKAIKSGRFEDKWKVLDSYEIMRILDFSRADREFGDGLVDKMLYTQTIINGKTQYNMSLREIEEMIAKARKTSKKTK